MADVTLNQVNQTLLAQNKRQESMANDIMGLRYEFADYFKFLKNKALDDLESKREGKEKAASISKTGAQGGKGISGLGGMKAIAAAAFVAVVAVYTALKDYFGKLWAMTKVFGKTVRAVIRPFLNFKFPFLERITKSVTDFGERVLKFFRNIGKNTGSKLAEFFERSGKFIDDMIKPIRNIFRNFTVGFSRIGTKATGVIDDVLKMEDFGTMAAKIGAGLKNAIMAPINFLFSSFKTAEAAEDFKSIGDALNKFIQPIKNLFSIGEDSFFGKMFSGLKSAFSFLGEGSVFMKTLASVGRVIGRLAWPITVIMGIIDSVTGAFEGFVNEDGSLGAKLLAGLKGGIAGLFKGLIGAPLDLIKSAVSWIIGKFGFKDAEKQLDSFSFTDLIHNLVMSPIEILKRAVNAIVEGFSAMVEKIPVIGKKTAKTLRSFKFEEGQTDTERLAAKEIEEARMKDAVERQRKGLAAKPINTGQTLSEEVAAQQKGAGMVAATSIGQIGDTVNAPSSTAYVGGGLNPGDSTRPYINDMPTSP